MVRRALIATLFKGFFIQRWNDKIRPVVLTEIDKNAHKMVIAYCLAKYEEKNQEVNWHNIIKGGIFEFLRRVVISDIKSPIYRSIKSDYPKEFEKLNEWVFSNLKHALDEGEFKKELHQYLLSDNLIDSHSSRILEAAHILASYWEFRIIKQTSPEGYQIKEIEDLMLKNIGEYLDLEGIKRIITKQMPNDFIDLVGQLRFQIRWSQTPRIPETSVLGHSMFVAILAYLFSREINACNRRLINNFFGGLFHDLPEALTRDIISPVKTATPELPNIIKKLELDLAEKELYKTIEPDWKKEIQYYIIEDDKNKITKDNKTVYVSSEDIQSQYNNDTYNPIDGELVKAADHLAAFVEARVAQDAGISSKELEEGLHKLNEDYKGKIIAGIDIGAIYADFST